MPDMSKLTPTHLLGADNGPTMEELKEQVEKSVAPRPSSEEAKKELMRARRYVFPFSFTSKGGEHFGGTFTSVVPDIMTRGKIGVMRAQLSGGLPYGAIDPFTNELNLMIATLAFMLEPKAGEKLPSWAEDLRTLTDADVIYALYEEVSAHETTFLGR